MTVYQLNKIKKQTAESPTTIEIVLKVCILVTGCNVGFTGGFLPEFVVTVHLLSVHQSHLSIMFL